MVTVVGFDDALAAAPIGKAVVGLDVEPDDPDDPDEHAPSTAPPAATDNSPRNPRRSSRAPDPDSALLASVTVPSLRSICSSKLAAIAHAPGLFSLANRANMPSR
jgi:hypothetical protein